MKCFILESAHGYGDTEAPPATRAIVVPGGVGRGPRAPLGWRSRPRIRGPSRRRGGGSMRRPTRKCSAGCCGRVAQRGLLKGNTIGIDATPLEANAARKAIVRRDTQDSDTDS